jgi:hypothetical protein
MATVHDVRLRIEPAHGTTTRFTLRVTYDLAFETWELASWFREIVDIVGVVDGKERQLASLTAEPFSPAPVVEQVHGKATVSRETPPVDLEAKQLDVEPAVAFVGSSSITVIAVRDDIAARVTIVPVVPMGHTELSPLVSGEFERPLWAQ